MTKIGILGFGFMGKMHFSVYHHREDVEICAICDANEKNFSGAGVSGNLSGSEKSLDLSGIELYTDFERMLDSVELDAVSITLPTNLHSEFSCRALERGLDVLCEKPMALTLAECDRMIAQAERSGKVLQIGHCIRFWPEYVKAKELVDSGKYGKVLALSLRRLSQTPGWSQDHWIINAARSGGVELDLHIHDCDYVQYLLGMPKALFSTGTTGPGGGLGHVMTQYIYEDNKSVFAEGGWLMASSFDFEMSFNLVLEKATVVFDCTREPTFKICPAEGDSFTPEVLSGDGYEREIAHFLRAVKGEQVPSITTLESSRDSIRIVTAEKQSVKTGAKVKI